MVVSDSDVAPQPSGAEPYVFECRSCGKVFEAFTRQAFCPECDSGEVTLLTD